MGLFEKYSSLFCKHDNVIVESVVSSPEEYRVVIYNANVPLEEYRIKFKPNEVFIEKKSIERTEYFIEKDEEAYKFAEAFIDCGYMQIE